MKNVHAILVLFFSVGILQSGLSQSAIRKYPEARRSHSQRSVPGHMQVYSSLDRLASLFKVISTQPTSKTIGAAFRMDSIAMYDGDSVHIAIQDSAGVEIITRKEADFWGGSGIWENDERTLTYRDTWGYDSIVYEEYWDGTQQAWVTWSKTQYDFNQNRLIDAYTWTTFSGSAVIRGGREYYFYNTLKQLDSVISEKWDTVATAWVPSTKSLLWYDNSHKLEKVVFSAHDGNSYYMNQVLRLSYNTFGKVISLEDSIRSNPGAQMQLSDSTFIVYGANGRPAEIFYNDLRSVNISDTKEIITYDTRGENSTRHIQTRDTETAPWEDQFKIIYTFHSLYKTEDMENSTIELFNTILGASDTYYFDPINSSYFFLLSNKGEYAPTFAYSMFYSAVDSTWYDDYIINYYYSVPVSVQPAATPEIAVYPNPARGSVSFKWAGGEPAYEVTLLDLSGRAVHTQTIARGATLDLSALAPGMYFYTLRDGQGNSVQTGKQCIE